MNNKIKYRSLRGMPDILPGDTNVIRRIEETAHSVFRKCGYEEIRTPLLEETDVFIRSIGEDTDIVGKEMYSFQDRGQKNISLRPEGTASVIRAYIENLQDRNAGLTKLYYYGPMFRAERPQKGRLRQFHQIGAEIIGASNPYIDAELLSSLDMLLAELSLQGHKILINSLGCAGDRTNYKKALSEYLRDKLPELCEDCGRRYGTNVLRVLDCKKESCRTAVRSAPAMSGYLCEKCRNDYDTLKNILHDINIDFAEKWDLARGLDYYTGTIFEVTHPALGAQDAIAAGGRYDGLTGQMGGADTGATGYAIGVERLLMAVDRDKIVPDTEGVLVVAMNEDLYRDAFLIVNGFRKHGLICDMDLTGRSFKGQMRRAGKENRKFIVILGDDEMRSGKLLLKDMQDSSQTLMTFEEALKTVREYEKKQRENG
ncbi:MAG: histidine--tRNA ligase [Candidatus Omnitrophota bacterium]